MGPSYLFSTQEIRYLLKHFTADLQCFGMGSNFHIYITFFLHFYYSQQSYNTLLRVCATSTTEFATGHQCRCTLPMEGVPVAIERSDAKRLMNQERSCQNIFFSHTSPISCPSVFKTHSDGHGVKIYAAFHK